jgi:uncharacterized protein
MQMTLDKWKPFISDPAIGMPSTAIFGHCTTMTGDDERRAAIDGPATEAHAESWSVINEVVEVLHATLAGFRNIKIS